MTLTIAEHFVTVVVLVQISLWQQHRVAGERNFRTAQEHSDAV